MSTSSSDQIRQLVGLASQNILDSLAYDIGSLIINSETGELTDSDLHGILDIKGNLPEDEDDTNNEWIFEGVEDSPTVVPSEADIMRMWRSSDSVIDSTDESDDDYDENVDVVGSSISNYKGESFTDQIQEVSDNSPAIPHSRPGDISGSDISNSEVIDSSSSSFATSAVQPLEPIGPIDIQDTQISGEGREGNSAKSKGHDVTTEHTVHAWFDLGSGVSGQIVSIVQVCV